MNVTVSNASLEQIASPLFAVPAFSDCDDLGAAFAAVDAATGGVAGRLARDEQFEAEGGSTLLVYLPEDAPVRRVLLVGLGKRADLQLADLRAVGAAAAREANHRRLASAAVGAPPDVPEAAAVRFLTEGALLGAYRYDTYKTREVRPPTCERIAISVPGTRKSDELERLVSGVRTCCDAVCLARDLVNGPPVEVTPTRLAEVAARIAAEEGLEAKIFDKAEIARQGMNLLLAVNAGSTLEPRFIHLTYRPPSRPGPKPLEIALVGKGLTFDAGGYNIKPTGSMEDMKMDMAGGAAVLATMKTLARLKPSYVVHGIVPSTENLISGSGYKPGDIYRAKNGKTVEIMNTDAEGRLILADALSYATELGVNRIVDLATLTGACMVALGPHTAGLFGNHDGFSRRVREAAERAGEDFWPLPLNKKLKPMLKSPNADMKNIGEKWGGAITGALFLQEFVGQTPWVHLDIAGPAFAEKKGITHGKGATGFAVLTLVELLQGEI
jgi:leucyl aminopeptidase